MSMSENKINKRFKKYGKDNCKKAYDLNTFNGEESSSIALNEIPCNPEHGRNWTAQQVDAMISTWDAFISRPQYILLGNIG